VSLNLELKPGTGSLPTGGPGSPALSRKDVERILRVSLVLLFVGLFGVLVSCWMYKPLDGSPIYITTLCLFLLPLILYFVSALRKRAATQVYSLRRIFFGSATLLIGLTGLLVANGALDRAPPQRVQSVVLRKYISRGRRSTTYQLDVRSWRSGRSDEHLQVGSRTYSALSEGQRVSIELHPGYAGVPWYGRVAPILNSAM